MKLTSEEKIIQQAIIAGRKVQEFLWQELSHTHDNSFDQNLWASVFQKRVDKIKQLNLSTINHKVELRKRILQQAALSIAALKLLNRLK